MITYLRTKNCGKFSSFWSEEVTGERPSWHGCQDPIRPRHGPATKIPLEGTILAPLSHAVTAILAWPATDFVCPSASNLPHCKRRDKKWQKLFFFHCPTWRKLWSDSPCSLCRAGEISWPTGRKAQWAFPLICGAWIRPTFQRCRTPLGSRWTYGNQSSSKSEKREREDTREEQRGKTRLVQKGEGKEEMSKHQSWNLWQAMRTTIQQFPEIHEVYGGDVAFTHSPWELENVDVVKLWSDLNRETERTFAFRDRRGRFALILEQVILKNCTL